MGERWVDTGSGPGYVVKEDDEDKRIDVVTDLTVRGTANPIAQSVKTMKGTNHDGNSRPD